MKIALPIVKSLGNDQPDMADSFHKSEILGVYCLEDNKLDMYSEEELFKAYGNIGLIEIFKKMKIEAAICKTYNMMAFSLLCNNDIIPFKAISEKPEENINMFKDKKLRIYQGAESLSFSCGSSCSGCGKECK